MQKVGHGIQVKIYHDNFSIYVVFEKCQEKIKLRWLWNSVYYLNTYVLQIFKRIVKGSAFASNIWGFDPKLTGFVKNSPQIDVFIK